MMAAHSEHEHNQNSMDKGILQGGLQKAVSPEWH